MTIVIRILIILTLFSCKSNKENSGYRQNILIDALSRSVKSHSTQSDSVFIADRPSKEITITSKEVLLCLRLESKNLIDSLSFIKSKLNFQQPLIQSFKLTDAFIPPKHPGNKLYIQHSPILEINDKVYVSIGNIRSRTSIWSEVFVYSFDLDRDWKFTETVCGSNPY